MMFGSFEFPTEVRIEDDAAGLPLYIATSLGFESRNRDQSQAVNDLNAKLFEAIQKGEITSGF